MVDYVNWTNMVVAASALWEETLVDNAAVRPLYNERRSTQRQEVSRGLGSMARWSQYNGTIEYDEPDDLQEVTYRHTQFSRGIHIPREDIDDNNYDLVAEIVRRHALAGSRTVAYDRVSVFNNAFSTSFPGPDGQPLCATTGRNTGKKVQANYGTSPLTVDAVKATRRAMMQMKDANGEVLALMPDTIVVGVGLMDTALEIARSSLAPDNANNAINTLQGLNVIVEPLLTDQDNWFMVDQQMANRYLNWFWRVEPEMAEDPQSNYKLGLWMRGYMRYSFGWDTHTWVYGHKVG